MDITTGQILIVCYFILSMILGGIVANKKNDYATRGAAISLFCGLFGPLFMSMAPASRARKGDKTFWPDRAPEATLLNIAFFVILYFIYR